MVLYVVTAFSLLIYLALTWYLGTALGLRSPDVWVLRAGLWIIGIAAAAIVILYFRRRAPASMVDEPSGARDIELLIREAEARLKTATTVRGVRRLSDLGTFLLLGQTGTAKTSIVLNSGLEPELMAGRAKQDGVVVPTEAGNVWFAAGQTWVELPAPSLADENAMRQVVRGLSPTRLSNLLGGSRQPPRAAIVCVDCAEFLRADAVSALPEQGKRLNSALLLLAREWGVRLPVYVLFTKLDRLPYFSDFVRTFNDADASQPLGVTLSAGAHQSGGAWTQQQAGTLTHAFDQLFRLLAARRTECLRREHDLDRTPNVYEHPRELRKLREHVARFLVELCRPSQLQASPFLRGFYFTGVRPVIVSDAPAEVEPVSSPSFGGATQIFQSGFAPRPAARASMGSHRISQWVYLSRLFSDVLLKDFTAQTAGGRSAHAGRNRRIFALAAAAFFLILIGGTTYSFFRNRALIGRVRDAEAAVRTAGAASKLARLDELRKATADVLRYQQEGPPLGFRWLLFPGEGLAQKASAAYCAQFGSLLLSPARTNLASTLGTLSIPPGPNDDYARSYDQLKAYLIATSHPQQADLSAVPALHAAWVGGREISGDQQDVARRQFDFYMEQRKADFCPAAPNAAAITRARTHLLGFELVDRTYRNMIAEVSKLPPVSFQDPGRAVVDRRVVPGAFTRAGWPQMQAAIKRAPDFFNREPWVLGDAGKAQTGTADLTQKLSERYTAEYLKQWQEFLDAGAVVRYAGLQDASGKLRHLSGSGSPLLSLFCIAAENTSVDSPVIAAAFKPVHGLTPPSTCAASPIGASNSEYMRGLLALQVGVERLAGAETTGAVELPEAFSARIAAGQTAQTLNLPQAWKKLLDDPILYAEGLAKNALPNEVNGKGQAFCAAMRPVLGQFPFNWASEQNARTDAVAAMFQQPGGRLWAFYAETLQPYIALQGNTYVSTGKLPVSTEFLRFFNRAADISRALFSPQPGFTYTVQIYPSQDIENVSLRIDGQTLRAGGNRTESQDFPWPGDGSGAVLEVRAKGGRASMAIPGNWAALRLMSLGRPAPSAGAGVVDLDIVSQTAIGRAQVLRGQTLATLRLGFRSAKVPGLFSREFFALRCEPRVAR